MLQPGAEIDVWVVEKALGSGGMGSVYRCHNKHALRILAAIKTLEAGARMVPEAEQRFVREAEILFGLDHPNVVKVRNIRLDLETPYLEMEFVEGESLEGRLCRGPIPPTEAIDLARQLFDAVAYLHGRNIRHRDVKPANLVITSEGQLKLVDFGLASEEEVERITRANTTFGTVSYAPPEWVQPDLLDPELWDVYACGVVFWEMLTARVAFPGSPHVDPRQVAIQIMTIKQNHPPLDPGESFTPEVRELVKDMTHSDPSLRTSSVKEALDRLRRISGIVSSPNIDLAANLPGTARRKPTDAVATNGKGLPAAKKKVTKGQKSDPGPQTSSAGWIYAVGGLAAVGVFLFILVGGLGGVWLILGPKGPGPVATATTRDVDIAVAGLQRGTDLGLRIGDVKPAKVDGFVSHFVGAPVGAVKLRWAVGPGCVIDVCPGARCPEWCDVGEAAREVTAGTGAQSLNLEITPPEARVVIIKTPLPPEKIVATLADGRTAAMKDGVLRFPDVLPGKYALIVSSGVCAPAAAGCSAAKTCPAGCSSWAGDLIVKPGSGKMTQDIALDAPASASKTPESGVTPPNTGTTPVKPPPGVDPTKPPLVTDSTKPPPVDAATPTKGGKAGKPTTGADFAKWLGQNPEWQRDAAIAAGKADDNYLREGTPSGSGAVVSVSWLAAQAFCASRGGLAAVDAEPQQWEEGAAAPFQEWRQKGGKPAWRRSDGADSTAAKRTDSNAFTGFRCAK